MEEEKKEKQTVEPTFSKKEIDSGKGMAVLSYILAPIPFFIEKENKFVKYHARQGMDFFIVYVAYSIIYSILTSAIKIQKTCGSWFGVEIPCKVTPWWISYPLGIIYLGLTIIAIIGIINAINGKAKPLPLFEKFKIIK